MVIVVATLCSIPVILCSFIHSTHFCICSPINLLDKKWNRSRLWGWRIGRGSQACFRKKCTHEVTVSGGVSFVRIFEPNALCDRRISNKGTGTKSTPNFCKHVSTRTWSATVLGQKIGRIEIMLQQQSDVCATFETRTLLETARKYDTHTCSCASNLLEGLHA